MNIASILVGVAVVVLLVFAIGRMNRGNGPCGGNCSTCAMSEHCEKLDLYLKEQKEKNKNNND